MWPVLLPSASTPEGIWRKSSEVAYWWQSMNFFIQLDVGYWLILLGLGGSMILTILIGLLNRKNDIKDEKEDKVDEIKSEKEDTIVAW